MNPVIFMDEQPKTASMLAPPFAMAVGAWFFVNGFIEIDKPVPTDAIVRCLLELGVVRQPEQDIWLSIKSIGLDDTVPFGEFADAISCILSDCRPSPEWVESAVAWMAAHRLD